MTTSKQAGLQMVNESNSWSEAALLCFLSVYYQSNEWAGVYGIRERDQEAWASKQDWSRWLETHDRRTAATSSSCSRTSSLLFLPSSLGRTTSSCWTSSSSCAASSRRGPASSRHAEPPTSAASGLQGQTGRVNRRGRSSSCFSTENGREDLKLLSWRRLFRKMIFVSVEKFERSWYPANWIKRQGVWIHLVFSSVLRFTDTYNIYITLKIFMKENMFKARR